MRYFFKVITTISILSLIAGSPIFLSAKPADSIDLRVLAQVNQDSQLFYNKQGLTSADSADIKREIKDSNQDVNINPQYEVRGITRSILIFLLILCFNLWFKNKKKKQ
ncbi:hypothetical protein [Brunnivagina elsteri]|uniref:Uncharacterized protein n=1 Tax=Brunnivagina elsteri CCALA 953 TaxID=987040 RepID=A0A2A2TB78_9CYAN|nr:hypothetical protein [Calothrix elsteri]PAX50983.1 hypothetical protein CK510_27275 [Calothrix elsteri CCALA 953]